MDRLRPLKNLAEDVIGARGKKWIKYAGLRARTALGAEPFASHSGIDRALFRRLGQGPGYFIEAGGNDGVVNSTSYFFEQRLGWRGFLVEPVPQLAAMARQFRNCPVHQVALGPPSMRGQTVTLRFNDAMSKIEAAGEGGRSKWGGLFGENPHSVTATIATLSDLLAQAGDPDVSFLTLDVEGYEREVLEGLDTTRHAPRLIVVETFFPNEVLKLLGPRYDCEADLTGGDWLYVRR